MPSLSASGGRRVLYATVALSPQLVHLDDDEARAAAEHLRKVYPGTWANVPMETWRKLGENCGRAVCYKFVFSSWEEFLMLFLDFRTGSNSRNWGNQWVEVEMKHIVFFGGNNG